MGRTALNVAGAANTAVIVAATEKDLDKDLYYGRKEFEDGTPARTRTPSRPRNRKPRRPSKRRRQASPPVSVP